MTLKGDQLLILLSVLFYIFLVTLNVFWLFLAVPWVGLQCVIVLFPDHTPLLLGSLNTCMLRMLSVSLPLVLYI